MKVFFTKIKDIIEFEKIRGFDFHFFKRFTYIYSVLLLVFVPIGISNHRNTAAMIVGVIGLFVFLIARIISKIKNKTILKGIIYFFTVFGFFLILMASCNGVNDNVEAFWCLMVSNVVLGVAGIVFSIVYLSLIELFFILLYWSPLGPSIQYGFLTFFNKFILHKTYFTNIHYSIFSEKIRIFFPIIYFIWFILLLCWDIFIRKNQMEEQKIEDELEKDLQIARKEIEEKVFEGLKSSIKVIDEKDDYTRLHSERVAVYSRLIAQEYGITDELQLDEIYKNALLHDVGKIAVPDAILKKTSKLTDEEFEVMKKHTVWGSAILDKLQILPTAGIGARFHHEKLNGRGYPEGVTGERIPLIAKIISVADALDAMNSNRVYRKHCTKEYIISEFEKFKDIQFEADLVKIVCELIEEGKIKIED